MTAPAVLCVVCRRREAKVGHLCDPDLDRLGRHLDPANRGVPFNPDDPSAPVRPPSIPHLYRQFVDLAPEVGERDGELAEAAELSTYRMVVTDARSRRHGDGRDDDGEKAALPVVSTLGSWARVVHGEHLDLEGRPDPLPGLARPGWVEVTGATTRFVEVTVTGRLAATPVPGLVGGDEQAPEGAPLPDRVVQVQAPGATAVRRQLVASERADVQAVEALCRWLHARLEWIAAQPWVDELVADLRRLTAQLRAGQSESGRPLGPCKALVDNDGRPWDDARRDHDDDCPEDCADHGPWLCFEPLWMPPLPPRREGDPLVAPAVRCAGCGTRWEGLRLLQLARDRGVEAA